MQRATVKKVITMKNYQSGVALIVGLIFLLLLTIIGLSSSNTAVLQERMAGNVSHSNVSFQSAELGLRMIEQRLKKHVDGGAGGLKVLPISWQTVAQGLSSDGVARNNCTLSGLKKGQDYFGSDQFCFEEDGQPFCVAALRSEYDAASDKVFGSPCRPIDRSDGTFGDNFFLTIARPNSELGDDAPASVQSIFYWP